MFIEKQDSGVLSENIEIEAYIKLKDPYSIASMQAVFLGKISSLVVG